MEKKKEKGRIALGRAAKGVAGWIILAVIAGAPWLYGGTRVEGIWLIGAVLAAGGVFGAIGFLLQWRLPQAPLLCWGSALLLMILAWVLAPRASVHLLSETSLQSVNWHLERWPGSTVDRPPAALALLACGILSALVMVTDLSRRVWWRKAFVGVMAVTGALIGIFGIVQALAGAEAIYWRQPYGDLRDIMPGHFFATFFHHSVAGAFLNLVWPLSAGMLFLGLARRWSGDSYSACTWWTVCAAAGLLAIFANVSKAAMAFALLLLLLFFLWPGRLLLKKTSVRQRMWTAGIAVGLALAATAALSQSGRPQLAQERWQAWISTAVELPGEIARTGAFPTDHPFDRFAGADVTLEMIEHSGVWGFGPGSWMWTFPDFRDGRDFEPFWLWMQFAHQDYLQTVIEWGLAGAFLWGLLAAGGIWRGIQAFREKRKDPKESDAILLYSILVALAIVFLHAMADFPLQIPAIQVYVAVLLGLAWSAPRWRNG